MATTASRALLANRYYRGPPSDHFDGERFFNPGQASTDRSAWALLKWRLGGKRTPWPAHVPVTPVRPEPFVAGLRVTVVGHATMLIQAAGVNLLTDPVWSERASPVGFAGPRRVVAPGVRFEDLPRIHAVLLSHCHYDHMDLATLRLLQERDRPVMAMPLGNDAIVRRAIPEARIVSGDWGERLALVDGVTTTLTPANHWANRSPWDVRMALWSGHWVETAAGSCWFVGDTGFGDGSIFRAVRAPDVALIPIGAYEPRWFMAPQHVNPAEAVRIFAESGARRAVGMHWGVFQLTDEGRDEPPRALAAALAAAGIEADRFVAGAPGSVFDVSAPSSSGRGPG